MISDLSRQDIGEIPYSASSRTELKRTHQWVTQHSGAELLSNKRQVVQIDGAFRPGFLTPHRSLSAWDKSLVPRHLTDCFIDSANAQHASHLLGRNISPIDGQYIEEQHNTVTSHGFPVVHGSSFNLDTSGKVKVNQVCESRNMPESMVQLFGEEISTSFQTGPSYDSGQDGTISFGQTCSNIDKSFILPGPFASKPDESIFSTFHPFEKGVENFELMGQSLQNPDCNIFSMSPSYHKGKENVMSLLPCDKVPENRYMIESSYHKENANVLLGGQSSYTEGSEIAFMVSSQDRADQNNDQISHEDRSKTISFGGYQKETTMGSPVCVINSYETSAMPL